MMLGWNFELSHIAHFVTLATEKLRHQHRQNFLNCGQRTKILVCVARTLSFWSSVRGELPQISAIWLATPVSKAAEDLSILMIFATPKMFNYYYRTILHASTVVTIFPKRFSKSFIYYIVLLILLYCIFFFFFACFAPESIFSRIHV